MNTKLTLRLDDKLIRTAKRYSQESGKSISQLVADYFALIDAGAEVPGSGITPISPRVRSLIGALKGAAVTEDDYRRYLEEKYR
jgi:uridine kinase